MSHREIRFPPVFPPYDTRAGRHPNVRADPRQGRIVQQLGRSFGSGESRQPPARTRPSSFRSEATLDVSMLSLERVRLPN